MDTNIILAWITEAIAWIFLALSFWKNKDNKIIVYQIMANTFILINYIFLNAYTGIYVIIFEIIRDIIYIKGDNDKKVFLLSLPLYLIIALFKYDGILSLFSIGASINEGYALLYRGKKVVILGTITYLLWLIYDLSCKSYVSVFAETIIIISNIIILIKDNNINKKVMVK